MGEILTLTLMLQPRGPAGAFVLSDEQVAVVGEVPEDLAAALADDGAALAAFEALANSHRKEFVRWVGEAKRDTTRAQRVARTLDMLRAGQHR